MLDSYNKFLSEFKISEDQFLDFGLKSVIYIPIDKAKENWNLLKDKINNDDEVFIRGFGRDAKGTSLFIEFYKHLLGNNHIKKDPTNNSHPTKMIKELSGYSKIKTTQSKLIQNYQISHIYGRTKNVYAFTAPWNIVYIPKIYDPFTGHEAKGDMVKEFTSKLEMQTYKNFKPLIEDFNNILTHSTFTDKLKTSLDILHKNNLNLQQESLNGLIKSIKSEFSPINIEKN
jgi:hypothetical protein